MSYIANSLAPHERLVLEARFPWLMRAAAWGALLVLGFLPTLSWVVMALGGDPPVILGVLAAISGIGGFIVFVWLQLYMIFTETGVTDQRLVLKWGIIARRTTDFPLQALENIDVNQGILQRIFGFGHLVVAGAGDTTVRTPPMQDPVSFRTALSEARIALTDPPAYRAKPVRIDPMQRANGPAVDAPKGTRHVQGHRGEKTATRRRGRRREARPAPTGPRRTLR